MGAEQPADQPSSSQEMNTWKDGNFLSSFDRRLQRRNSASTLSDGQVSGRANPLSRLARYSVRSASNLSSATNAGNASSKKPQKLSMGNTTVTIMDSGRYDKNSESAYGNSDGSGRGGTPPSGSSSIHALQARDNSSKGGSSIRTLNGRQYPLFNGLISDVRNRFPLYKSDIVDAANFQCLTSLVFMIFASFAPSITFGGLMGSYTDETMGTIETLLAQCLCGVIFGLFAAQPLLIMSPTGPVLIFEASLYTFCEHMDLDFLTVRLYTGAWIFTISVCTAAVDGSRLLAYVTRFTEDIFATLISAIFIAESIRFLWHTFKNNPVEDYNYYVSIHSNCQNSSVVSAAIGGISAESGNVSSSVFTAALASNAELPDVARAIAHIEALKPFATPLVPMQLPFDRENQSIGARNISDLKTTAVRFESALRRAKQGIEASGPTTLAKIRICGEAEPNTALLTAFIMIATFSLALLFKRLRESFYFGKHIRRVIGDFGVLIAIVVVAVAVQMLVPDPYLQRLDMPDRINFTNNARRGHGLFVWPMAKDNTWLTWFVALVAALLIFILLYVETEITELLLSRRERGCRKGNGMNWDLMLMGFCAFLSSLFGLPWMCAAAVQSLAHCSSLTVTKKKAPGGNQEVDHVIEQRMTTIGVSLTIGAIALGGGYLRMPLASLFGVFLYLGVMNLAGVQFVQRVVLFFIPEKYFPSNAYTEQMSIWRMHLYTWIQLMCLFVVYIVKYFKRTALAFPFVLALFIVFRQLILPRIFTEKELKAVDGEEEEQDGSWMEKDFYEHSRIPI